MNFCRRLERIDRSRWTFSSLSCPGTLVLTSLTFGVVVGGESPLRLARDLMPFNGSEQTMELLDETHDFSKKKGTSVYR